MDISVMSIPRRLVPLTLLSSIITIVECVTIPCWPPRIVQSSTTLIPWCIENEMSMPCVYGRRGVCTVQCANADVAAPDMDPVHPRTADENAIDEHVMRIVDVDPVLAALDRDAANRDMVGAYDDAPADDGSRLADELLRSVEHERPLVHAGREAHGRRQAGPADAARGDEDTRGGRRAQPLRIG